MNRFCSIVVLFLGITSATAQVITDFGTGQFTVTFNEFTTTNQTATTLQVQGTDINALAGSVPTVTIPVNTSQLALTGTLAGTNPNSSFVLALADSDGNELDFDGAWTDFTLNGFEMTVILNLANTASFNGNVTTITLFNGGTSGEPLDFTFNRLAAVPEPSSLMLSGMSLLLLSVVLFPRYRQLLAPHVCR